jgi:penicillin-binding protein A
LNAHLRRTFYLFVAGFVALVGVLAYWQVYARTPLATDPANSLQSQRVQETPRGLILAGDGETELAQSIQENDGFYSRFYPQGPVYSHVVGYWSPRYGASGIEIAQTNNLSGSGEPETLDELMNQVQGGPDAGNDVELTLDPELQRLAYDELASSTTGRGAAVAINPKNGEILSLASYPSYDPNDLDETFPELSEDPNSGLLNRATQGLYPPGSTFKVITAAGALLGGVKPTDKFTDTGTYETPGYDVYNYKARVYGNVTFMQSMVYSVNAIFARLGYEYVGAEELGRLARDFGFGDPYEDFPLPIRSSSMGDLPPEQWAKGLVAQLSFGQGPATSHPFQMALVAATIANHGTMMEPRLVREVRSPDGVIIDKPTPRVRQRVLDQETAQTVNDMMQHVVTDLEIDALIPGVKVAGKTGTAEAPPDQLHSWFISFAPADDPEIAVAVIVENGQEGYKAALPIAHKMMETYLKSTGEIPEEPPKPQPAQPKAETTQPTQPKAETTQPVQPKTQVPQQTPQPAQGKSDGSSKLPFQNPFQDFAKGPKADPSKGPGG